jgi:hypothetical protein
MTIDFSSRQDLNVTTLKEFFEIFISSLKQNAAFHKELISKTYTELGLSIKFETGKT